jgi:hypothetical protein
MWELGGVVAIGTKFYDTSTPPILVAATSVVATITLPDGTTNTPTVTNPSTGTYAANYTPTQAGRHPVTWSGVVGGLTVKYTDVFNVQEAAPPLILSLDEARDYLNMLAGETVNDEELRGFIEAATPIIEKVVGPCVRRTVTSVIYPGDPFPALPLTPVISLTSGAMIRDGSTVDVSSFVVENGCLRSKTYVPLPYEPWTLTYVVGRAIIPANIRTAAGEVVSNLWASQRGASIRAGESTAPPWVLPARAANALEPNLQLRGFA